MDSDRAGLTPAARITARLRADERFSHVKVSIKPPHRGKDYNEDLSNRIRRDREQPNRQKKADISL
jgi:hypothetical protein